MRFTDCGGLGTRIESSSSGAPRRGRSPRRGAWGGTQWTGWWGDDPPYHHPVFILAQQYLAAGLLDDLELNVVPVVLCDGARLFDNLGDAEVQLEQVRAVEAPGVTHLKYRSVK